MPPRPTAPHVMTTTEWGLLLALAAVWAGSFIFVEVALAALPPMSIVLARVGIAALALTPVILLWPGARNGAMPWRDFAIMSVLNNIIPFALIFWGQTQITASLAAILNATTPVFTVLLAHWLTADERMTANKLAGVVIGVGGVAVMIGPAALHGLDGHLVGQVAVLAAAISYALAGIFGRRLRRVPAMSAAWGQVTLSTVLFLPVVLLVDRPWTLDLPGVETWVALIGLGTVSTALAYGLYFRLLATAGATNLLLVTLLIPPGAVALGVLVLGEVLAMRELAGMAVIGLSLLVIDGRLLRRPSKHK